MVSEQKKNAADSAGRIRLENKQRIIKAAEKIFAMNGFRGATTADIAAEAGLPKANIHYYFRTKEELYRAVLDEILTLWVSSFREIKHEDDPASTLADYIRAKMELSQNRPYASRVFANELIRGAPRMKEYLQGELKEWVEAKAAILDQWIAEGRMAPLNTRTLIFHIWAMTQTWADFEVQWAAILSTGDHLGNTEYEEATNAIISMVLRSCGLTPVPARMTEREMKLTV